MRYKDWIEWQLEYIEFIENYRDLKDYDCTWEIPIFEQIAKQGYVSIDLFQIGDHDRDTSEDTARMSWLHRYQKVDNYRKYEETEEEMLTRIISMRLEKLDLKIKATDEEIGRYFR